jgi:hypothetical protein
VYCPECDKKVRTTERSFRNVTEGKKTERSVQNVTRMKKVPKNNRALYTICQTVEAGEEMDFFYRLHFLKYLSCKVRQWLRKGLHRREIIDKEEIQGSNPQSSMLTTLARFLDEF